MGNANEKMSELKKRELLNDLNDLKKGLLDYKKRQERHVRIKFTEGQMKKLDQLRERTRRNFRLLRNTINKCGGNAPIKIAGINYDAFEYSLNPRSLSIVDELFTSLDMAINTVDKAIREIEAIPIESIDWRDISIAQQPKKHVKETISPLEPMQLHPEIIKVSKSLFESGHYPQAILEAFKTVNNRVKQITGLSLDGKALMSKAFSEEKPLIALNELTTQSERDEQEGFKFLFMGAMVGIRNPLAHEDFSSFIEPHRALEYLGFASLLMGKIEVAMLE